MDARDLVKTVLANNAIVTEALDYEKLTKDIKAVLHSIIADLKPIQKYIKEPIVGKWSDYQSREPDMHMIRSQCRVILPLLKIIDDYVNKK